MEYVCLRESDISYCFSLKHFEPRKRQRPAATPDPAIVAYQTNKCTRLTYRITAGTPKPLDLPRAKYVHTCIYMYIYLYMYIVYNVTTFTESTRRCLSYHLRTTIVVITAIVRCQNIYSQDLQSSCSSIFIIILNKNKTKFQIIKNKNH